MSFRYYDNLRVFNVISGHDSFSSAAEELHLTKGAISHQIKLLEMELGFPLFLRHPRGISLTVKGKELLATTQISFDNIEQKIRSLRQADVRTLTIGVTTYFASRWLSPRLMDFMRMYPDIRLRVQPMVDLTNLKGEGIDLAIRWGNGKWDDVAIQPLFICPAWPAGNLDALNRMQGNDIEKAFEGFTLLRDHDDSTAWSEWYAAVGLPYQRHADTLIIPDPNVRVQAVIDGQGVALNDELVEAEITAGKLHRLSNIELSDFGYFLAFPAGAMSNPDIEAFASWIKRKA
jgi:DNA-binding transcriptional LysR family regulator